MWSFNSIVFVAGGESRVLGEEGGLDLMVHLPFGRSNIGLAYGSDRLEMLGARWLPLLKSSMLNEMPVCGCRFGFTRCKLPKGYDHVGVIHEQ